MKIKNKGLRTAAAILIIVTFPIWIWGYLLGGMFKLVYDCLE